VALHEYRRKRDFQRTPEPKGRKSKGVAAQPRFVVQKHAARRLHYDFRLELGGVLKSWAVPKGPSLNPGERRLAVHVEDHPIEYGDFEGVIPEGEYGGGTVLVWDQGSWLPEGDADAGYRKGHLRFRLLGRKLHGTWNLVRTSKGDSGDGKENWLLIKSEDEFRSTQDLVKERPESVLTGRDLKQVAAQRDRVWHSPGATPRPAPRRRNPAAQLPASLSAQLATLVDTPPDGDRWLHEIKYDGYRILARIEGHRIQLFSRNGKDWSARFPSLCTALRDMNLGYAWLDGEVAFLMPDGRSSFSALQNALSEEDDHGLVYLLFDLPFHAGRDVRGEPLSERKALLGRLLEAGEHSQKLRFSDHVRGHGPDFYAQACQLGLEGIISKLADRPYRSGRSRDWLKLKCLQRQEFVVLGFTEPGGSRTGFGALLLGVHGPGGELRYAGRVGTGFDQRTLTRLRERLDALRTERAALPPSSLPQEAQRGARWVRPELVAEVAFADWTRDGVLRHPSYQGLREDKPAAEVVHEAPSASAPPPAEQRDNVYSGLRLSNPEKVLYPGQGVTKRELAEYYTRVADKLLAEIADRPLTLLRCPNGHHESCFFQKHASDAVPEVLHRVRVEKKGKSSNYLTADSLAGVIALVQMGVLEIHIWGARRDRLDRPDRLVFDLDPDEGLDWSEVVKAARRVRTRLEELGLNAFVKTTGGKGLHVVTPILRRHPWEEAKAFSRAVAADLVRSYPGEYTSSPSKTARRGKLFIDYLRNGQGATSIANYSTRAREGATVALPIAWGDLDETRAPEFNIRNIDRHLQARRQDPWQGFDQAGRTLSKRARQALGLT